MKDKKVKSILTRLRFLPWKSIFRIGGVFLAIYLIIAPFLPLLENPQVKTNTDNSGLQEPLTTKAQNEDEQKSSTPEYVDKLYIPAIQLTVDLHISDNPKVLDLGAWLKSSGSRPGQNGNVIITGHKFVYFSGIRPFYHLYLTPLQAQVYIVLHDQVYIYQVSENFIVNDYDASIELPSTDPILTIYTCEGLDSTQRRVIRANFVKQLSVQELTNINL